MEKHTLRIKHSVVEDYKKFFCSRCTTTLEDLRDPYKKGYCWYYCKQCNIGYVIYEDQMRKPICYECKTKLTIRPMIKFFKCGGCPKYNPDERLMKLFWNRSGKPIRYKLKVKGE